jgi:imidazoleglycerol-phosphate dehydratase
VDFPVPTIGTFDAQLVEVFWESVAATAGMNFHALLHHGRNGHHIAEAVFKAAARALRVAVEPDPRQPGIPSTKGTLTQM